MGDATTYGWLKRETIDRGEIAGLSTGQADGGRMHRLDSTSQEPGDRLGNRADAERFGVDRDATGLSIIFRRRAARRLSLSTVAGFESASQACCLLR